MTRKTEVALTVSLTLTLVVTALLLRNAILSSDEMLAQNLIAYFEQVGRARLYVLLWAIVAGLFFIAHRAVVMVGGFRPKA